MKKVLPFNSITEESLKKLLTSAVREYADYLPYSDIFTLFRSNNDKVYELTGITKGVPLEPYQLIDYAKLEPIPSKVLNNKIGPLEKIVSDKSGFTVSAQTRSIRTIRLTIEHITHNSAKHKNLLNRIIDTYKDSMTTEVTATYSVTKNLHNLLEYVYELKNYNLATPISKDDYYLANPSLHKDPVSGNYTIDKSITVTGKFISANTVEEAKRLVTTIVVDITVPLYDTLIVDLPLQVNNRQLDRKLIDFVNILVESSSEKINNFELGDLFSKTRTYRGIPEETLVTIPQLDKAKLISNTEYNTVASILLTLDKTKPKTLCSIFTLPDFKLLEPYVSYLKVNNADAISGNLFKFEVYRENEKVENISLAANGNITSTTVLDLESNYRLVIGIHKHVASLPTEKIEAILNFLKPIAEDFVDNNKHLDSNLYTYALAESAKGLKYKLDDNGNLITPKGKLSFIDGSAVYELVDELNNSEWYISTTNYGNLEAEEDMVDPVDYHSGSLPDTVGGEWIKYKGIYFHKTICNEDNDPATDYTKRYDTIEDSNIAYKVNDFFKYYIWDKNKVTKNIPFTANASRLNEYYKDKVAHGITDLKYDFDWIEFNDILYKIKRHTLLDINDSSIPRMKLVNDTTVLTANGPFAYYKDYTLWLFHNETDKVGKIELERLTEKETKSRSRDIISTFIKKDRLIPIVTISRDTKNKSNLAKEGWHELTHSGIYLYSFQKPVWNDWNNLKIHHTVMDYEIDTEFMKEVKKYLDSNNYVFNQEGDYNLYCWDNSKASNVSIPKFNRVDALTVIKNTNNLNYAMLSNTIYKVKNIVRGGIASKSKLAMLNGGNVNYYTLPNNSTLLITKKDTTLYVTIITSLEEQLVTLVLDMNNSFPKKSVLKNVTDLNDNILVCYTGVNMEELSNLQGYIRLAAIGTWQRASIQPDSDIDKLEPGDLDRGEVIPSKPIIKPVVPIDPSKPKPKPIDPTEPERDKPKPPPPSPTDTEIWRLLPGRPSDKIWVHRSLINLNDTPVTDDSDAIRAWPIDGSWKYVWEQGDSEAKKALPNNIGTSPIAYMPIVQFFYNKAMAEGSEEGGYKTLTKEQIKGKYDYYIIKYNGKYLAVQLDKFQILDKPFYSKDGYDFCYGGSGYRSIVDGNKLSIEVVSLLTENVTRFVFEPITEELKANYTLQGTSDAALSAVLQEPDRPVKVFVWLDLLFDDSKPLWCYNIPNAREATIPKADVEIWRDDYLSRLGLKVHNKVMNYKDKPKVPLTEGFVNFLVSEKGRQYSFKRNREYGIFYVFDESKLETNTKPPFYSVGNSYNVAYWLTRLKTNVETYTKIGNVVKQPIMYVNDTAYKVLEVSTEEDSVYQSDLKSFLNITDPNIRVMAARDMVMVKPDTTDNTKFYIRMYAYQAGLHPTIEWDKPNNKGYGVVVTFKLQAIQGTRDYVTFNTNKDLTLDNLGKCYSRLKLFNNVGSGVGSMFVQPDGTPYGKINYSDNGGPYIMQEFVHQYTFTDSRPVWVQIDNLNRWYSKYSTYPYVPKNKDITNKLEKLKTIRLDQSQYGYFFNADSYSSLAQDQREAMYERMSYASTYNNYLDTKALKDPKCVLLEINKIVYKVKTIEYATDWAGNNPEIEYLKTELDNVGMASNRGYVIGVAKNVFWYISKQIPKEVSSYKSYLPVKITLEPYEFYNLPIVPEDGVETGKRITKHMYENGLDSTRYLRLNSGSYVGAAKAATADIVAQDNTGVEFKRQISCWDSYSIWTKANAVQPTFDKTDLIRMNYDKWLAHHPLKAGEPIHEIKQADPIMIHLSADTTDGTITMTLDKYTPIVDNVKDTVHKVIFRFFRYYPVREAAMDKNTGKLDPAKAFFTKEFVLNPELRDVPMTFSIGKEDAKAFYEASGGTGYKYDTAPSDGTYFQCYVQAEIIGHTQTVYSGFTKDRNLYIDDNKIEVYRPIRIGTVEVYGMDTKNPTFIANTSYGRSAVANWNRIEYLKYKVYEKDKPSVVVDSGKIVNYGATNVPLHPGTDTGRFKIETDYVLETRVKYPMLDSEIVLEKKEWNTPRASVDKPTGLRTYDYWRRNDQRIDIRIRFDNPNIKYAGDRGIVWRAAHVTILDKTDGVTIFDTETNICAYRGAGGIEMQFNGIGSDPAPDMAGYNIGWKYGHDYNIKVRHICTDGIESEDAEYNYTTIAEQLQASVAAPVAVPADCSVVIKDDLSRTITATLNPAKVSVYYRVDQTIAGSDWKIIDKVNGVDKILSESNNDIGNIFSYTFIDSVPTDETSKKHEYIIKVRYFIIDAADKNKKVYSEWYEYTINKIKSPFRAPDRQDSVYPTVQVVSKTPTSITIKILHPGEGPRKGYRYIINGPMGIFTDATDTSKPGTVYNSYRGEYATDIIPDETYTFTGLIPNNEYKLSGSVHYAAGTAMNGETYAATYTYNAALYTEVTDFIENVNYDPRYIYAAWDKVIFIDWIGFYKDGSSSFTPGSSLLYTHHYELRKDSIDGEVVYSATGAEYVYPKFTMEMKHTYYLIGWWEFLCRGGSDRRAMSNKIYMTLKAADFNKALVLGSGKIEYTGYGSFSYYDSGTSDDINLTREQFKNAYNLVPVDGNACYMLNISIPDKYKANVKDINWKWKMPWQSSAQIVPKNDPTDIFKECKKSWPWGTGKDLTTGETKNINATSVSLIITFEDDSTQVWSIY